MRRPLAAAILAVLVLAGAVVAAVPSAAAGQAPDEAAEPPPSSAEAEMDLACDALGDDELVVATKEAPPFVHIDPDGEPGGFSIELWQLLAARLGIETTYVEVDSVAELLDEVESGRADAANAAISINAERQRDVDFTTPTFTSGLRVLVPVRAETSYADAIGAVFSTYLFWVGLGFLGLVLVAGTIVWLLERRHNDDFHTDLRGIGEGMWWAVVTMATVGYGDRVTRSPWGRLFSVVWILVGIVLVAQFTATITARLTVDELTSAPRSVDELVDDRIVTVQDTAPARLLEARGIPAILVPDIRAMVAAVAEGRADAAVYDGPILEHAATLDSRIDVIGEPLTLDYYAIAVASGSPLRECLDRALIDVVDDGTWQRLHDSWFAG